MLSGLSTGSELRLFRDIPKAEEKTTHHQGVQWLHWNVNIRMPNDGKRIGPAVKRLLYYDASCFADFISSQKR